jgi:serine-type D-Ala-D-Ala carboxypeptidase/endopeptidase (penicillin-binding protein 4)
MIRWPYRLPLLLVASAVAVAGCDKRPPATTPAVVRTPAARGAGPDRLRAELATTFDSPAASALWAVKVQSLDSGEVLYEQNAHRLVMPASNMKIVTMAVAAERLGWDYRFPTTLETAGRIENGVLIGDLVVVGHGDPTISDRGGSRTRVFERLADKLRELGITRIDGRLIGDDDAFDDDTPGEGWAWDDLTAGYAAAASALQFNENVTSVIVHTAGEPGQKADVRVEPTFDGLQLRADVTIAPADSAPNLFVRRDPFAYILVVAGTVPKAERDYVRTVTVPNPTNLFVNTLRDTLEARGISVVDGAHDIDIAKRYTDRTFDPTMVRKVLFTHLSPPLSEIGVTFMKVSQNLFGETLLNTIGLQAGLEPCPRSFEEACRGRAVEAGRKVYENVLGAWGVPSSELIVSDGSGLSRYNYLTPNLLVTVLRRMARDPRHAAPFDATLPIMGKDGTLARRLRGTRAEGVVHAKTGSLANVRALSGYLTTADGERIVFSIVANNFKAPSAVIDGIADQAVERLVSFKRYVLRRPTGSQATPGLQRRGWRATPRASGGWPPGPPR